MTDKLIDLMECPLKDLAEMIPKMPTEVAMSTIKARMARDSYKIRKAFSEKLFDKWIPENCHRGEVLSGEKIEKLASICNEALEDETSAAYEVSKLFDRVFSKVSAKAS